MGEKMYLLKGLGYPLKDVDGAITESELKDRFRVCVEKWRCDRPWEMILKILLHGEGEKDWIVTPGMAANLDHEEEPMASTRHDFFKKRLKTLGLYDKDSDYNGMIGQCVEELSNVFSRQRHSGMSAQITLGVFNQLMDEYNGKSFSTPSRQEWEAWAKEVGSVIWGDDCIQERRFVEILLSMPIVPKEK